MTDVDLQAVLDALTGGGGNERVTYRLELRGPDLYPRLGPGCWWCHDARHGQQGSSCPVVYAGRTERS